MQDNHVGPTLERDAYKVLQVDPEAEEVVIRVAYRALAAIYHPDRDQSARATRRMAELNAAYETVRTRDRREAYDRLRQGRSSASATIVTPPPTQARQQARTTGADGGRDTLDFGRYAGWTITQLARQDPDYLRWLSRHSAGIRHRAAIKAALQRRDAQPPAEPQRARR